MKNFLSQQKVAQTCTKAAIRIPSDPSVQACNTANSTLQSPRAETARLGQE
jgi:hypothetical protein